MKFCKILGLVLSLALIGFLCYAPKVSAVVSASYTPVYAEADGVDTTFDFTFKVFSSSDIDVNLVNKTTLVETAQTLGVNYTVTLNKSTTGGTVTFNVAPANTYYVSIRRGLTLTQTADIPAGGLFREVLLENALDKTMMIIQEQQEAIGRALLLNPYGGIANIIFPAPEADKIIGWNAAGTALENQAGLEDTVEAAEAAQAAAELAETNAKTAETNAKTAETNAELAETNAKAAYASAQALVDTLRLPTIAAGTAGKILNVNAGETAWELDTVAGIGAVALTGDQTVGGVKTFSSFPITPSSAPTTNYQTANKKYVDDADTAINAVISALSYGEYVNGTTYTEVNSATERCSTSTSWTKLKELSPFVRSGQVTIIYDHKAGVGGTQAHDCQLYVNGVAYGAPVNANNTEYASVALTDFSVNEGDVISVYGRYPAGSYRVCIQNLRVLTNNPTIMTEVTGY